MNIENIQVGMTVRMQPESFVTKNFDSIESGFIDKTNKIYLSHDMYSQLIGKTVSVEEIDSEDPVLNVKICGFWIPSTWVLRKGCIRKKVTDVPDCAADGSKFGPIFRNLISKHPKFKNLSTNRFSKLTSDELKAICKASKIKYDEADIEQTCTEIAIAYTIV